MNRMKTIISLLLTASMAVTCSFTALATDQVSEPASLKAIYSQHGIKAGTCLSPQMITDSKMAELILEQFDSVTMENAMKPDYILDQSASRDTGQLTVTFQSELLELLDWAKENDLSLRGHTLVWYSQTPDWIFYENFDPSGTLVDRDTMLARMESYISQVFALLDEGGYTDLFYAYDVANEAWMEDGSMRTNLWSETIGDDYLWYAFSYADQYAPTSIDLYYNDYNEQFKSGTVKRFVETLVADDGHSLIDGIGLQGHLYTRDNLMNYLTAVDKLSSTGLKLEITELDVSLGSWQETLAPTEENLKAQGKFYYILISKLLERVDDGSLSMDAITFWGFDDELSWRKEASPLLFDKDLVPKYAFYGALGHNDF